MRVMGWRKFYNKTEDIYNCQKGKEEEKPRGFKATFANIYREVADR